MPRLLILGALAAGVFACTAASAGAEALARCTTAPRARTLCGRVTVPLDRSGAVPGTIALRVKALPPAGRRARRSSRSRAGPGRRLCRCSTRSRAS